MTSGRSPRVRVDDRSANLNRTSGWERYTRQLISALGDRVAPMHLRNNSLADRLIADWVTLPRASNRGPVIHFPTYPPTPRSRGSIVWTIHDLTWWLHPETSSTAGKAYYGPLASRAVSRRDTVLVTPSWQVRQEIITQFNLDESRVIATPLGITKFPDGPTFDADRPYFLAVATQEPRKNLRFLIDAYQRSSAAKTYDLRLVGRSGWGSETPPGAIIMSNVSDSDLVAIYRGASALVSPSIYEGFGLPLIESMSLGVPVICSDIPVFREVTGGNATFFDPHIIDDLVATLDNFQDPAASWRERGRNHALTYTWDACAKRTQIAYERATSIG